ncbi:MAG: hypothetical protein LBS35_09400 [Synergistaceae bacterium]|jgi:hypothetical protein|nr:hypothetical protein [Synergistaceae bacterium]
MINVCPVISYAIFSACLTGKIISFPHIPIIIISTGQALNLSSLRIYKPKQSIDKRKLVCRLNKQIYKELKLRKANHTNLFTGLIRLGGKWRESGVKMSFLGIDLGTSGVKAIIIGENGGVLGSAVEALELITPQPLFAEQSPGAWWEAVARSVTGDNGNVPIENIVAMAETIRKERTIPLGL